MGEKPVYDTDGLITRSSGKWAVEKLYYLKSYIEIFEKSMKGRFVYRSYIDLLAGPGRNYIRRTKNIIDGSPLIALNTQFPFSDYFFIDSELIFIEALQARCKNNNPYIKPNFLVGDCNKVIDKVLCDDHVTSSNALNLAFIDPEGFEVKWETIVKLASIKRMDLIINYPEGGLNRMLKKCFSSHTKSCLDDFFGGEFWRTIYNDFQNKKTLNLHRDLIDSIKQRLEALGYVFIRELEINTEPLLRNTERNAPQYRLIHASKNQLGSDFWSKITKKDNFGQERLPLI